MTYDIYTFGGGEILNGVFNAIAMCLNGQNGSLFAAFKHLGLILGTFWAMALAIGGDQVRVMTHWILPMVVLTNVLFVPTATVWIHDPVAKYHQKVDHVPYGLAAFAGHISKIGYEITKQVEKTFSLPEDLRYQKSGFLFASDILQKAKSFHITNAELSDNMREFVGQCIMYDAMLGRKYSIHDLRNSDDIWGLVSENPSQARSFVWRDLKLSGQPRSRPEIITCAEGVNKFNALWGKELDNAANLFGTRIFGKNSLINPKTEFYQYLPLAYQQLGNIAKSATDIIKQQMMIYSIVDGVEKNSTALGNAPNFAARRAYLQQRSTYETLGAMAGETLPIMKAVLEAIIYSFFLFIIPLSLMPSGYQYLITWAQGVLWLQMWAPLYAILNYIMTIAASSKTLAALSISNSQGITIASSIGVTNANADIAAMAGYLAMSVPFLSIALVKGVGSFVHMASHLGNVSQGAASAAAGEVTSGNLSFGNISEGNRQISNSSMLNHSNAASYRNASTHFQDGRTEITTMADGSQVINVGSSNLPVSLNVAESQSAQQSEMASRSLQNSLNQSENFSKSISSSARSGLSFMDSISKADGTIDSASYGITAEQSQALSDDKKLVDSFAKQNNISQAKSAQLLANAALGAGLKVGIDGTISTGDQEIYDKAQSFAHDHHYAEVKRASVNASSQLSHTLNDEKARRLAEETSASFEQGMSHRDESNKSFRESEDYNRQANFTRANSASINYNANQQFGEWLAKQPADNTNGGTLGHREAGRIMASNPQLTMAYAQRFMQAQGLNPVNTVPNGSNLKSNYAQEQGHKVYDVNRNEFEGVRAQAKDLTNKNTAGEIRDSVKTTQSDTIKSLEQGNQQIAQKENVTKDAYQAAKDRGVIKRLKDKTTDELIPAASKVEEER